MNMNGTFLWQISSKFEKQSINWTERILLKLCLADALH